LFLAFVISLSASACSNDGGGLTGSSTTFQFLELEDASKLPCTDCTTTTTTTLAPSDAD
jgi:hypothetical protein